MAIFTTPINFGKIGAAQVSKKWPKTVFSPFFDNFANWAVPIITKFLGVVNIAIFE